MPSDRRDRDCSGELKQTMLIHICDRPCPNSFALIFPWRKKLLFRQMLVLGRQNSSLCVKVSHIGQIRHHLNFFLCRPALPVDHVAGQEPDAPNYLFIARFSPALDLFCTDPSQHTMMEM